jgi:hypothetical protein
MISNMRVMAIVALGVVVLNPIAHIPMNEDRPARKISRQMLEEKIRGGWAGQMIGVSYGAPTEFQSNGKIIEGNLKGFMDWKPERLENALQQDDLYVDMTFAEVMDRIGLDATTQDFGDAFRNTKYSLWHANAAARRLLNRGIKSPMSGLPRYNIHANDIDFQIEADFIGLMTPGLPQESNKYCERVGRVMNYGDGLYGGMFVSGMYAAAFFETDPAEIVRQGLATIPNSSGYARIIRDTLDWWKQNPDDWKKTWRLLQDKWDRDDSCTGGALQPFNIDARLNGAYIVLGLLYGQSDFSKTMEISVRSGQDSDCNPASAAGVLGVMLGYEKIPEEWKRGLPSIADKTFQYTNYSFNTIVQSTIERSLKVIQSVGGEVTDAGVTIPYQAPKPARLEQWTMGTPEKIIGASESAWSWTGDWTDQKGKIEYRTELVGKITRGSGAEGTLTFSGTAVALVGPHSPNGGRADVFLDGKKAGQIDFYLDERTHDDSLWHVYDLKSGTHTIKIVARDDADPRSKGKEQFIVGAITYK